MSKAAAIQAITAILSGYPTSDSQDRQAFMQVAVKALESYPDDLLAHLASPTTGIVRKSKFLPTVAEMVEFMDSEWQRTRRRDEQAERDAQRALPAPDEPPPNPEIIRKFGELLQQIAGKSGRVNVDRVKSNAELRDMAEAWLSRETARIQAEGLPKLSDEAKMAVRR